MSARNIHWRRRLISGFLAALFVWFVVPAPLSGYWHTPYSDCLCDSKNLRRFENGASLLWAASHHIAGQKNGTYQRSGYWYVWKLDGETVRIKPGWFLMRIETNAGRTWGYRELNRNYIDEVIRGKPLPGEPTE